MNYTEQIQQLNKVLLQRAEKKQKKRLSIDDVYKQIIKMHNEIYNQTFNDEYTLNAQTFLKEMCNV